MRRLGVTLDDDVDRILRRAAPRGEQAAFIRRAIIETATRDGLRLELDVMRREFNDARATVYERLSRIERILGIGDDAK